jgi:hypothetical protein
LLLGGGHRGCQAQYGRMWFKVKEGKWIYLERHVPFVWTILQNMHKQRKGVIGMGNTMSFGRYVKGGPFVETLYVGSRLVMVI